MRIAALSDIHSNIYALETVLQDVRRQAPDLTVNLGDILYGPIAPRATYDRLMEAELLTIRGNQDRQIYEADQAEIDGNPTLGFILEDLGRGPLDWMRGLPFDLRPAEGVYLCHGTPENDLVYLLEDVGGGGPALRRDATIRDLLAGEASDLVLCGHTHIPRTVQLPEGPLVVNPGSVGLPAYQDDLPVPHVMENNTPHASYAVMDRIAEGWRIQHVKLPYAHEKAAADAARRGRADWQHALMTGCV